MTLTAGALVLHTDSEQGWLVGKIESTTGSGEKVRIKIKGKDGLLSMDQVFAVTNDSISLQPNDLLESPDVHESLAFQHIKNIFNSEKYCVSMGEDICIIVNPYSHNIPGDGAIYGEKRMKKLLENNNNYPEAHPWHLAREAYRRLCETNVSSTIIVTGESGAGKTESARAAMKFLTVASESDPTIADRVMAVNCILEVFGNAKTARNDNSSRFGKHTILYFDPTTLSITGSEISTYLLEITRITSHGSSERNFHSFYAFFKAPEKLRNRLLGAGKRPNDFKCLNPGSTNKIGGGINDDDNFKEVTQALLAIGIDEGMQEDLLWRPIAGIVHLLNTEFTKTGSKDDSVSVVDETPVVSAAHLFGISSEKLISLLTTSVITIKGSQVQQRLSITKATAMRDGLAKFLYKSLFAFLVEKINKTLKVENVPRNTPKIGILDLFGFENFKENKFEQFLINYANEKIQSFYNTRMFDDLEQRCRDEGVSIDIPRFDDNSSCLELVEAKRGILRILEDECSLGELQTSDAKFLENLNSNYMLGRQKLNPHFDKPKPSQPRDSFIISHYAGPVMYTVKDAIQKNKSPVRDEMLTCLGKSAMQSILPTYSQAALVSQTFKEDLGLLLDSIRSTETLWIRCIKPNSRKVPKVFEGSLVRNQLHCNGVIPTIRLLQTAPKIQKFEVFLRKYGCLLKNQNSTTPPSSACGQLQQELSLPRGDFQVGISSSVFTTTDILRLLNERVSVLRKQSENVLRKVALGFHSRKHVFNLLIMREQRRIKMERQKEQKKREEELNAVDETRRGLEMVESARRQNVFDTINRTLLLTNQIEEDRNRYANKAHKHFDLFTVHVHKVEAARHGKEQEYERQLKLRQYEEECLMKKHEATHQEIMSTLKQRALRQEQDFKKREERVKKLEADKKATREEKERLAKVEAYRKELKKKEAEAKAIVQRKERDTRKLREVERRLQQEKRRIVVENRFRAVRQKENDLDLDEALLIRDRDASHIHRCVAESQWQMQQKAWEQHEYREASRYLEELEENSIYQSVVHRDTVSGLHKFPLR